MPSVQQFSTNIISPIWNIFNILALDLEFLDCFFSSRFLSMGRRSICPTLSQRAGPSVSASPSARVTAGRVDTVAPAWPPLSMSFSACAGTDMSVSSLCPDSVSEPCCYSTEREPTGLAKGQVNINATVRNVSC